MYKSEIRQWNKDQKSYERKAAKLFINHFKKEVKNIPFEALNSSNVYSIINGSIKQESLYNVYYKVYETIGIEHGKKVGKRLNRDIKNFVLDTFISEFQRELFRWILTNVGNRIISVNSSFKLYIQSLIQQGFNDGKTTEQIAAEIKKLVNRRGFYKWQSLRIARTETTAAANRSIEQVATNSGLVYEKTWLTGQDERVRTLADGKFDHKAMHLKTIGKDEFFNVNNELIKHPAALTTKSGAKTSAGNVIQCRCTYVIVPKRDSNGRIIRI